MRKLTILLVLLMIFSMPAHAGAMLLIDLDGSEIALDGPVSTIISLAPSITEILCDLGANPQLIAIDAYSNYPPEAIVDLPIAGDYYAPNIELIVSLNPDIVLMSGKLQSESMDKLAEMGIKTAACEARTWEEIPGSIGIIASICGVDPTGLLKELDIAKHEVAETAPEIAPKVYYAMTFGDMGDWTAGKGTFIDDMITLCGGINVAGEPGASWYSTGLETITAWDPDIIILGGDQTTVDAFCAISSYSTLNAVKNGKVYAVNDDIITRPGPRVIDALHSISGIINDN